MDSDRRNRVEALLAHAGDVMWAPVVRELLAELDVKPPAPPAAPSQIEVDSLKTQLAALANEHESTVRDYESHGYGLIVARLAEERDALKAELEGAKAILVQYRDTLGPYRAQATQLAEQLAQTTAAHDQTKADLANATSQLAALTGSQPRVLPHQPEPEPTP